jgi:DNA-binding GntR family transcriptional regulator
VVVVLEHARVADKLRKAIDDKTYPAGGKLPSEADLGRQFAVSRTTVRRALSSLQNEGLLESKMGKGHFVRTHVDYRYRPQDDFQQVREFRDADSFTISAKDRNPDQDIEVTMVRAPADIASRFGFDEGELVFKRSRVRKLNDEPYQLNDSYYRREVANIAEIWSDEPIARGVNRLLAEHGFEQVRALDEFRVRMPTPQEADVLDIKPGTPVAEHLITGFTGSGPVRVVKTILPGDRNVITFERIHPDHVGRSDVDSPGGVP